LLTKPIPLPSCLRYTTTPSPSSDILDKAASNCGLQSHLNDPNASPVRLHNRCKLTGRPKGYIRQFGISRVMFREMANKGLIPGVTKASW